MRVRVMSQAGAVPQEGHKVSLGGSRVVRQSFGVLQLLGGWSAVRSSLRSRVCTRPLIAQQPTCCVPCLPLPPTQVTLMGLMVSHIPIRMHTRADHGEQLSNITRRLL